jgi:hypothetical protein
MPMTSEELFKKWQGWILGDLRDQFEQIANNHYIFDQFMLSINPIIDSLPNQGIATWMAMNHFDSMCLAIRRQVDTDRGSISLRNLLTSILDNIEDLSHDDFAKNNPIYRSDPSQPFDKEGLRTSIEAQITAMDRELKGIKQFVNKSIAHTDRDRSKHTPPNTEKLYSCILNLHRIYRNWAFFIAGVPTGSENPNHLDISSSIKLPGEAYQQQFSRLWKSNQVASESLLEAVSRLAAKAVQEGQNDLAFSLTAVVHASENGTAESLAALLRSVSLPSPSQEFLKSEYQK